MQFWPGGEGGGGNLNEPIIKSSNSWRVACGDVEIWNWSVHYSLKGFFVGFLFFKTGYNVPCTFYKHMGLDLQKLTKSLHGLTELKMTLQSVILFQKCNKGDIH